MIVVPKVLACLNELSEFQATLSQGSTISPANRDQWTWYQIGIAAESLGQKQLAVTAYTEANNIEPVEIFEVAKQRVVDSSHIK